MGIPSGAVVTAVNAGVSVTLNVNATANGSPSLIFGGSVTIAVNTFSGANIFAGQSVTGTYIPAGSVVVSWDGSHITINQPCTGFDTETITLGGHYVFLANNTTPIDDTKVFVGGTVSGLGIQPGTTIVALHSGGSSTGYLIFSKPVISMGVIDGVPITIWDGVPQSVLVTDPYSVQVVDEYDGIKITGRNNQGIC